MTETTTTPSWRETLRNFLDARVLTMLFLGFSAGIPILLIFSSLSLWLGEAGVERKAVTFFSWAALGYSFKFVWAPLIDKLPLPLLTRSLGKRRAWLLLSQALIMLAIVTMGSIDPALSKNNLTLMAFAAVLLGFSSATQDIVIDAYRIESAETRLQALMSSTYIVGYRVAMIVAGAGALYLAAQFGSEKGHYVYTAWRWTYFIMAAIMLVGVLTTFVIPEPKHKPSSLHYTTHDYLRLVLVFACTVTAFVLTFFLTDALFTHLKAGTDGGVLTGFLLEALRFALAVAVAFAVGYLLVRAGLVDRAIAIETWIAPIADFFKRYGVKTATFLLVLIGFYRISDIVLGAASNVFYQDLDFSKQEIATAVKTVGVLVSVLGGVFGGLFATQFGVMKSLLWGAILAALTNLVFVLLAVSGHNLPVFYLAVIADNLAAGFASAAFVAFLSALTSVSFTAVQYAIFSSLMSLFPKVLGGYSGTMVDAIGYPSFFIFTTLIGLPVIGLVLIATKFLELDQSKLTQPT
ncbi:MFS transporter, PAT family, beta-lactamase induction signal transducer AmpG [Thiothrix eikelboomii]|uniref:MFS transporter, PAT family, beta-lactamase induction signal transducer AmpG n=1 Tax=Thiothrix eikelboomii TaxID=92487 RepID=A0A1T4WIP7_9GAMM|nr:MFS transporter [Thiothrix eikelboomii]SKA77226.1 MFS transporter, PAT family, beta-lactamase induction signal transducer AmpG [Thiothrix eikelboomii]